MTKIEYYENIGNLLRDHGTDKLTTFAKGIYDDTDCGVWVSFITVDDEIHAGDLDKTQDTLAWALRHVVGVRVGTIVEGSDAEYSGEALMFPCFGSEEFENAIADCEMFSEENFQGWED